MDYIAQYAGQSSAPVSVLSDEVTLSQAIIKGLKESAFDAAKAMVQTIPPLDIINQELIPALDKVGKEFETGTLFLPQLLMSAEAAKAAFDAIKSYLNSNGEAQSEKGQNHFSHGEGRH